MRTFDDLVHEADSADVSGWDFGWLDGRATEERPPWRYAELLSGRLCQVSSALDIDTGGGEVVDLAPTLPRRMVVTESWGPNLERARRRLEPRGVRVIATQVGEPIPLPDRSFELITARHPVVPMWGEICRLLEPGGRYFAQHVGPASAFELVEYFLGPQPDARLGRDPQREVEAARSAGLELVDLRTARLRMEFFDIGAVVWILRKCVWWVPDFSAQRYEQALRELDAQLRAGRPFVAHSSRHLLELRRPDEAVR